MMMIRTEFDSPNHRIARRVRTRFGLPMNCMTKSLGADSQHLKQRRFITKSILVSPVCLSIPCHCNVAQLSLLLGISLSSWLVTRCGTTSKEAAIEQFRFLHPCDSPNNCQSRILRCELLLQYKYMVCVKPSDNNLKSSNPSVGFSADESSFYCWAVCAGKSVASVLIQILKSDEHPHCLNVKRLWYQSLSMRHRILIFKFIQGWGGEGCVRGGGQGSTSDAEDGR